MPSIKEKPEKLFGLSEIKGKDSLIEEIFESISKYVKGFFSEISDLFSGGTLSIKKVEKVKPHTWKNHTENQIVQPLQYLNPKSYNDLVRIIKSAEAKNCKLRAVASGRNDFPCEYVFNIPNDNDKTNNNKNTERRFYNTGTWIPVIETSTAEVREDKIYSFLHLIKNERNKIQPANDGLLQRWNDDAGRTEAQVLIQRK